MQPPHITNAPLGLHEISAPESRPPTPLRERVKRVAASDVELLERARVEVRELMPPARDIRPGAAAARTVAIASAEAVFRLDPIEVRVVRVADSDGNRLVEQVLSPATDPETLAEAHRRGRDPVALLMDDLGADSLHELSPAIPPPGSGGTGRRSWLAAHRDLCEWAALCERVSATAAVKRDVVLIRRGLLRATSLGHEALSAIGARIAERAEARAPRGLHVAGVALNTDMLARYGLALELEGKLPAGQPRRARVPLPLEPNPGAVGALDAAWLDDDPSALFVARLGGGLGDPLCAVELLDRGGADAAFSALANDARGGFPSTAEPGSLQRAERHAAFSELELRSFGEAAASTLRRAAGQGARPVLEPALFGRRAA